MSHETAAAKPARPRFTVRRKPSRTGRGEWCVIDRQARKVDSRYVYEASARQVAESLSAIEHDRLAGTPWPIESYTSRWTCITPEIAPSEAEAIEEPTAQDRADWAAMSNDDGQGDDHGTLLASLDSGLSAFLDRVGADSWEEADLAEFRR